MSQRMWVTVAIDVRSGVDIEEVFENMDYSFEHKHILDHEIVDADFKLVYQSDYVGNNATLV